jgi:hypothetical protein
VTFEVTELQWFNPTCQWQVGWQVEGVPTGLAKRIGPVWIKVRSSYAKDSTFWVGAGKLRDWKVLSGRKTFKLGI